MTIGVNRPSSPFTSRVELIATFEGDAAFADELVATFLSRVPTVIQEIEQAFSAGDTDAGSRLAHALKGSVGYFGDRNTHTNALMIEKITVSELSRVPAMLSTLKQGLVTLTRYLVEEFAMDATPAEALGL